MNLINLKVCFLKRRFNSIKFSNWKRLESFVIAIMIHNYIYYNRTDESILNFRLKWRGPNWPQSANTDFMVQVGRMRTLKSMLVRGVQYGPSHERRNSNVPESVLL